MLPIQAAHEPATPTTPPFGLTVERLVEGNRPLQLLRFFLRHPEQVRANLSFCARIFRRLPKEVFHRSNVLEKTQEVFRSLPEFAKASCDAFIQAGERSIALHRNLVAAQCPILEEKLRDEDTEWADFPLLLSDVSSKAIEHVLNILEMGLTRFEGPDAILETLKQGASWDLEAVTGVCEKLLVQLLASGNALALWQYAFATGRAHLLLMVGEFIRIHLSLEEQVAWTSSGSLQAMVCAREYLALATQGVVFTPSLEQGIRVQFRFRIVETIRRALTFLAKIGATRVDLSANGLCDEDLVIVRRVTPLFHSLEVLNLSSNPIGSKGVHSIVGMLRGTRQVAKLGLANSDIGGSGVGLIADVLRVNSALKGLDLSANRVGRSGAKSLGAMLKANQGLEELNLNQNVLERDGLKSLLEGAAQHPRLKRLRLQETKFGSGAHLALMDFLRKSQSIETLDLSYCGLTDAALKTLASGVELSRSLRSLKLRGNHFTSDGVAAFSRSLACSPPLTYLDLSDNEITGLGLDALSRALMTNNRLEVLKLAGLNPMQRGEIRSNTLKLAEGLRQNKTLRVLDLSLSRPYMEGLMDLLNGLLENDTLDTLNLFDSNLQETLERPENAEENKRYVGDLLKTVKEALHTIKRRGETQVWW